MAKSFKITLIALAFLTLGLLLHFDVFSRLPLFRGFYENAVLTVNTRRSPANVYINGVDYGQTPTSIPNLSEGGHTVELERITENPETYPKQSFYIELYRNTEAVIDVEIAPNNFKSGHILFYLPTPTTFEGKGIMSLRSDKTNYEVFVDGTKISSGDVLSHPLEPGEYQIKVESQGYESLEFPVIIRENYNLNIRVYLLPIPISF